MCSIRWSAGRPNVLLLETVTPSLEEICMARGWYQERETKHPKIECLVWRAGLNASDAAETEPGKDGFCEI